MQALQGYRDTMFYTYTVIALSYPSYGLTCVRQFKEIRLWGAVVQDEMRYQHIRDLDLHVGHENMARLAVDNSLRIASLHSPVTVGPQTQRGALNLFESKSS